MRLPGITPEGVTKWVCQLKGVTDLDCYLRPALRRPSKVMSKALRAAFHRLVHRLRLFPVGSRLMIARYRHFRAGRIQPDSATPGGFSDSESS